MTNLIQFQISCKNKKQWRSVSDACLLASIREAMFT